MTYTCPNGHASTADDYCDTCGAPIAAASTLDAPAAARLRRRAPRPGPAARRQRRRRPRAP